MKKHKLLLLATFTAALGSALVNSWLVQNQWMNMECPGPCILPYDTEIIVTRVLFASFFIGFIAYLVWYFTKAQEATKATYIKLGAVTGFLYEVGIILWSANIAENSWAILEVVFTPISALIGALIFYAFYRTILLRKVLHIIIPVWLVISIIYLYAKDVLYIL